MQGIFEGGTSLGDVYEGLVNGHLKGAVAEFLADQTSDPSAWELPSIQHAEGFEAYQVFCCQLAHPTHYSGPFTMQWLLSLWPWLVML